MSTVTETLEKIDQQLAEFSPENTFLLKACQELAQSRQLLSEAQSRIGILLKEKDHLLRALEVSKSFHLTTELKKLRDRNYFLETHLKNLQRELHLVKQNQTTAASRSIFEAPVKKAVAPASKPQEPLPVLPVGLKQS